jgi:hypothetical protein
MHRRRARFKVAGALITGGILLAALVTTSSIASSGVVPSGTLLFCKAMSVSKCGRTIYAANGDGSNPRVLTNAPVVPSNLDFSPKGDRFLFTGTRNRSAYGLYLGSLDGKIRTVTSGYINGVSWSPDGKNIAYGQQTRAFEGGSSLVIANAASLAKRVLVDGSILCKSPPTAMSNNFPLRDSTDPLYSTDGSKIAYNLLASASCKAPTRHGIALVNVRTGKSRNIVFAKATSEEISLLGWRDGSDLVVIDAAHLGSSNARILSLAGRMSSFFGPDGLPLPPDNGAADDFVFNSMSRTRQQVLLSVESCSQSACGYTTRLYDFATKRLSAQPTGNFAGWSAHGAELMTYQLDGRNASTTAALVSGADLTQDWTVDIPMPVAWLAWSG